MAVLGAAGVVAVAALATAATAPTAQAATVTIDPLESALGYNAFIEGDTTLTSHESEGPIATGGNLTIGGTYNVAIHTTGTFIDGDDAQPSALVVGGRLKYGQNPSIGNILRVLNEGYVKIGDLTGTSVLNTDTNNASVNTRLVAAGAAYDSTPRAELTVQQPIDSVGPTSPIDFDTAFADFRSKASQLAECENTVTMRDPSGLAVAKGEVAPGQQIRISLESGTTNVLDLTGEDLNNMANLTFLDQPSADTPLLINVDTSGTGGELDWDVATQAGISGTQAPYILWDWAGTTELNTVSGDTVEGTVYAPDAVFSDTSPANIEGQIIAKQATLGDLGEEGGEIHQFPFAAELSCETDVTPSPSPSRSHDNVTWSPHPSDADGTTGSDGSDGSDGSNGAGDGLATTGGDARAFMITAASLVAVGAVALIAAGRRRARE
ncbi:choice-of-anchor A family protein [Glycomyces algeriensis]|uniref:Choice-of-anchor A domain-containing protein n=1 Tax=Glycomyces algeriensis TaxID=256037 RepID=A0A9W6G5P9_9ACTN|nr:choice-of-anchor A family protein [Glycomyces algeriensis]MDA1367460.1 choice-of-anchor A family protein [Glycomyces algeriensis]MDR7353177.1 choice-of-anchor A domain-containing protein [Glycomyces algeriensis]GLI40870.1 hypothetical protein GALLR39Z86_07200 [Glycomyces algeriensis]